MVPPFSSIKCVAFDLGGVLVDVQLDVLKELKRPQTEIENAFFGQNRHQAFGNGTLKADVYTKRVAHDLKQDASTIETVWGQVVQWKPFTSSLLNNLNVPFVFWSNTDPIHCEKLKHSLQLSTVMLEKSIFSYEAGVLKPDAQFFKAGLEKVALEPEQVLFIDDRPENVSGARDLKINAHQIADPNKLIALLESFNLLHRPQKAFL